jgi:OOP family OmpA-OmpF porin
MIAIVFMFYQTCQVNAFTLTPYFGGYRFEGNTNVGDTLLIGLGADFQLTDSFATDFIYLKGEADLNYLNMNTQLCETIKNIDTHIFHMSGRYHLFTKANITPYVTTGLGIFSINSDYAEMFRDHPSRHYLFQFHYGGGMKYYLTKSLSIRGDLRHMISFDNMDNDLSATFGISYTFGTPAKEKLGQRDSHKKHEDLVSSRTKDASSIEKKHPEKQVVTHSNEKKHPKKKAATDAENKKQTQSESSIQAPLKTKKGEKKSLKKAETAYQEEKKPTHTDEKKLSPQQFASGKKIRSNQMASQKGQATTMHAHSLLNKKSDKELQMAYVDTDADGIYDHVDKCPATPHNVSVNMFGCAPDLDRDGVIDVLDQCPGTHAKTKVDKYGCRINPIIVEKSQKYQTTIQFDYKSAQIKETYHAKLFRITQWMKKMKHPVIIINSHTDNIGSQIYNINLSDKRADSLKKYLHEHFLISEHLITTYSFGETQPVADNATEEGRQKNRRAEVVVTENLH